MISRRQLRMKVLQSVYAFHKQDVSDLAKGEKALKESVDNIYDLFIYQLSALVELAHSAEKRLEEGRQKHLPTVQDLNPNTKFIENPFIAKLEINRDYLRNAARLHISWEFHQDTFRKIFRALEASNLYQNYLETKNLSFNEERQFILQVYKEFILPSEALNFVYEEKNIHWSDDIYIAAFLIEKGIKTIKSPSNEDTKLPPLFKQTLDENGQNEDMIFMQTLFRKAILNRDKNHEEIVSRVKNWDFDRIAYLDLVILQLGMTEVEFCQTIPTKVSINEYIDLAKMFSTPRSSIFINGVLDRFVREGIECGRIKKIGRGLVDE